MLSEVGWEFKIKNQELKIPFDFLPLTKCAIMAPRMTTTSGSTAKRKRKFSPNSKRLLTQNTHPMVNTENAKKAS